MRARLSRVNLCAVVMRNAILGNDLKVIPLKLSYYQTFFETWRNERSYEHYKNDRTVGVNCFIFSNISSGTAWLLQGT